jgi:hypothetical protein
LLKDEPLSESGDNRSTPGGFVPFPPSMIERRLSNTTGGRGGTSPSFSPGEIVQPAIALTSPLPGTSVPFFVPSRPSSTSPMSPYHGLPYDGSDSASQTSKSQTPRSLPVIPPLTLSPSTHYTSGSSITPYYTSQRSGVSDRTSSNPTGSANEGMTDTPVRLSDFPPVPDSGISGTSGGAVYATQAGLHQNLSPFAGVPFNTVPESPFADPHIQTGSQPERIRPNGQNGLLIHIAADASSERALSLNPLPEIHFEVIGNTDTLRAASSEFPVSALANSFAIPSPPVRDSLEKPQGPTVVIKPSPLREATTASVSSPDSVAPSTRDIKGKGKARMTDSFYEGDEYAYVGI